MKKAITGIALLLMITCVAYPLRADRNILDEEGQLKNLRTENTEIKERINDKFKEHIDDEHVAPDFSIGFGGSYGFSDTIKARGDTNWSAGYTCGGGLIVEKMFSNHYGLHSGIWYSRTEMDFSYYDDTLGYNVTAISTWQAVTIPVHFMLSLNASRVSLVFLGGFNLSQNIFSELKTDDIGVDSNTADVLNYVSYFQFGIAGGINLKFRISRFFDFFIGGTAELYLLDMLPGTENNESVNYPYNYRAVSGVLFRTNLFPIETD